jgi:hypothetical protein
MTNTQYNYCKQQAYLGAIPWSGSDWFALLCNSTYTPNFSTDTSPAIIGANQIGTSVGLSGLSVSSAGVLTANSATFTGIASGLTVAAIVIYWFNGTSYVLGWYDNVGTGLPYTTIGSNILVEWSGTTASGVVFTP